MGKTVNVRGETGEKGRENTQRLDRVIKQHAKETGLAYNDGCADVVVEGDPYAAFEGRKGAVLQVFSTKDGSQIGSHSLTSPPAFDGMAAANGRLYLATQDGKVLCMSRGN